MNLNRRHVKTHVLVAILFLFLAVSLEALMYGYWSFVLQPRLYVEAESKAKILAESQAALIASALSTQQSVITQDSFDELSDQVLVFVDPALKRPYFLGVALELDGEVVGSGVAALDLAEGDMSCQYCFAVTTALYSPNSYELLGVANFRVSDAFYKTLKNDVKRILFLESSIALAILLLVWIAVHVLIRKLNHEIQSRKNIARQLRHAKENAERISETKSEFLANMSHEIRTPMNAVIGMSYLLLKTPLNERQQDLLHKLDAASHLLLNLINDLLDFSKIEAGKLELEETAFNIDEVLDSLAEMVMTKAGEKSLDLMYHTDQRIPAQLIGDPLRLGQVLLNLLSNAIKFTESGEIVLTVELVDHVLTEHPGTVGLQFSVRDTGIGIKEQEIAKLFQSFTQADSSTTRKFGGTGLGLSISKQLVQLMGGDITVVSTYGQGSTFSFTVNLGVEPSAEPVVYTLPAVILHTHVLVVDDNQVAQSIFQQMLEGFGFKVSTASSAHEGIALLQYYCTSLQPIKLVLMDWKMAEMNGIEASELIKTQLGLEVMPVIILVSAYNDDDLSTQSQPVWDDYLVKPICQSVLYDAIVNVFSGQGTPKKTSLALPVRYPVGCLSNKQVLLVEDNQTNQEVACALMEELHLQVSIANNGREAVEAIKCANFDLIFMDLQMPEMDGFEATRRIRLVEDYQQVPIIAMTAHAMQGDREKCLGAQMNDYITKPIHVDKFFTMLNKWLVSEDQESVVETRIHKQQEAATERTILPVLKAINMDKALVRVRGKQALLLRLLSNFKKHKATIAEQITVALQQNDLSLAKALVHSLKGEAGTLEATTLFAASKQLEQQLLQGDTRQQQASLWQVTQALEHVLQDITLLEQALVVEQQPAEVGNGGQVNLDVQVLTPQLQELATLLQSNNLRAKKLAKLISPKLGESLSATHWGKLLEALSELNFEQALVHLQAIADDLKITI